MSSGPRISRPAIFVEIGTTRTMCLKHSLPKRDASLEGDVASTPQMCSGSSCEIIRHMQRKMLRDLLNGTSQLFFLIAGMLFFFGGRALHEFVNVERILAEAEGIGLAVLFGVLGVAARSAATCIADSSDSDDQTAQS